MTHLHRAVFTVGLLGAACGGLEFELDPAEEEGLAIDVGQSKSPVRGICPGLPAVVPASGAVVIDGVITTGFGAGNNGRQTITIDLGCSARITGVRRFFASNGPPGNRVGRGELVAVSTNNSSWTQLTTNNTFGWTGFPTSGPDTWTGLPVGWSRWLRPNTPIDARYVRFSWDGNNDSLAEVEVDLRSITSSHPPISGTSPWNVIDGDLSTTFRTANANWQDVTIDLGRTLDIGRLRRSMTGVGATRNNQGEQVLVSLDGSTWTRWTGATTAGWEAYDNWVPHAWKRVTYGMSVFLRSKVPTGARFVRFSWDANNDSLDEVEIGTIGKVVPTLSTPTNGTARSGRVTDLIPFAGYATQPGAVIRIQALARGSDYLLAGESWVDLGPGVTAASTPTLINGDPVFAWSTNVAVVGNANDAVQLRRWPEGGVARVRVLQDDVLVKTFDSTACRSIQETRTSLKDVAAICGSHSPGIVTLVDGNIPSASRPEGTIPPSGATYLDRLSTPGQGNNYYRDSNAPMVVESNIEDWAAARRFTRDAVQARYYNAGDLGLGRDMNCGGTDGGGIACYVTNYGEPDDLLADEASALAGVHAQFGRFATVAMDYRPGLSANEVRFYVFDHQQVPARVGTVAALDSEGGKAVPGVCLACHGGTYDPVSNSVSGANFLPFDPTSFRYSADVPRDDEAFRKLNALVLATDPTPSISELINGWYRGTPNVPGTPFDPSFVPNGWRPPCDNQTPCKPGYRCTSLIATGRCVEDQAVTPRADPKSIAVYREVFAPYCRTCHIAQALPFDTFGAFNNAATQIQCSVCTNKVMPHAEVVRDNFWRSGARGHLLGALDLSTSCPNDAPSPIDQACGPP